LLEAMVALVIVALGMIAVNEQLNRYAIAAGFIEQKTLASWIATNKLTELSVGTTWPQVGNDEEDVEFAGQKWRCLIEVSKTDVENLHRVDVSVVREDQPDRVIDKVSALIEPPAPAGFRQLQWPAPGVPEEGERE
jgi:general secretion pathway protein I